MLFFSASAICQQAYKINLTDSEFIPQVLKANHQLTFESKKISKNRTHQFIQFYKIPTLEENIRLQKLGVYLLDFIGASAYVASVPVTIKVQDLLRENVRAIWTINDRYRMSDEIKYRDFPTWAIDKNMVMLNINFYKDVDRDIVLSFMKSNNIEVLKDNGINNFLVIKIAKNKIQKLLDQSFIIYVECISPPPIKDDRRGRSLHRVNKMDPNVAGQSYYSGKNINVLVRDDGAVFNHIDFKGRNNQDYVGESHGDHGDGVAGIMCGAGNLIPENRGMAHRSFMYVIDYDASFLDATLPLFLNSDVIVTNSSYSNGCNRGYSNSAKTVDQQLFDNPTLMHVFSAGNDGTTDCDYGAGDLWGNITGGHKMAKNAIAVANVNYKGEIMESSSRGPAHDGRIKPDIAANGNNHISTDEKQGYRAFGGTSGAAPVVAGVTAMLHEAYEVHHGERSNGALLKAVMLNTANDLGNKGPDFIYGWGLLNGYRAMRTIEEGRFLKGELAQDGNVQHTISVPPNVAEVRIMTYWPDAESFTFTNWALINDINTKLIDSHETEYLPWVLDHTPNPALLSLPATKGTDNRNNMEQVTIDNPMPGDYVLDLQGYQLPFGNGAYYVVWDFRMNDIDIVFPNGGESIDLNSSEVIHWDAEGNDGEFTISLISGNGDEQIIGTKPGDKRLFEWKSSKEIDEFAKIKISRNGISDVSDHSFLIGNSPKSLRIVDKDSLPAFKWKAIDSILHYNIYVLESQYMQKVTSIDTNYFPIPSGEMFQNNWVAVSAVYVNGTESKRSKAISTTKAPIAFATNDVNNLPCINEVVIFESQSIGEDIQYIWKFGNDAIPSEEFTAGPHEVRYFKKGNVLAALSIKNDGGSDQVSFILNVKEQPQQASIESNFEGAGEFSFSGTSQYANNFEWDFGDGNSGSGKNTSHTYEQNGEYLVVLKASNNCGESIEELNLNVITTSTDDLAASNVIVYPNPSNGNITIKMPNNSTEKISLKLSSIDGRIIWQRILSKNDSKNITLKDLSKGVYSLTVAFNNKTTIRKVVIN